MTFLRPLHLVQVSLDDSVFSASSGSDALERQCGYARLLCEERPGSRLTLLVLTGRSDVSRFAKDGAEFVPLAYSRWWHLPRVYRALEALHRAKQIDVISPQNVQDEGWAALFFAKRYGISCVGQIHFDYFSEKAREEMFGRGLRGTIRLGLTQWALPRFDQLRVVGRRVREGILERGSHRSVSVIPVPISVQNFAASPAAPSGRCVLFVGRLVPAKNLDAWLEVARRVAANDPAARFRIVGTGPEEARLRAATQELGIASRVEFTGAIPNRELGAVYRDASVFLLTSHYEGFGRVVAEAQAQGVPVVAPRLNGVEDIVADGISGIVTAPGDVEALADSVTKLLNDPKARTQMGLAGRRRVLRLFDPERLARSWVELLVSATGDLVTEPPLRATWRRWRTIASTKYSLLRGLEYERLEGLRLAGRTLDLGGGARTSYRELLTIEGRLESVNIDLSVGPSLVGDLNQSFPFSDAVFDNVISFNTLEHLTADRTAVAEALRVLKPGGAFHFVIPFLYRVHGSPSDFHRHTAYWWTEYLSELGVAGSQLRIEPLVWDPLASGFAISEFEFRLRSLWKRLALLPAVVRQLQWRGWERLPNRRLAQHFAAHALGYYIHGTK